MPPVIWRALWVAFKLYGWVGGLILVAMAFDPTVPRFVIITAVISVVGFFFLLAWNVARQLGGQPAHHQDDQHEDHT